MITICVVCGRERNKSPSKVSKRPCCSRECQVKLTASNLQAGEEMRYLKGHKSNTPEHYQALRELLSNDGHPKWKGEKVSYRGLHQWVRRKKGHPNQCSKCGKQSNKPRVIQWANIDGKYRRALEDFVGMCCSCHKKHDRWISGKATQDGPSAI